VSEGQFLSRRELREAERAGLVQAEPVIFDAPASVSSSPATTATRRQLRQVERSGALSAPAIPLASEAVWAETEEPMTMPHQLFSVSPNLHVEPQTASIVIAHINDVTNFSAPIGESGEMLKTGSIELPILTVNTGEIAMILGNETADRAIAEDSIAGFVSTIEPVSATGIIRAADKINIVPSRANFDQSRVYLSLTISLFLVASGGLVLGAYMLGFFR
jgi:hypothetical protein